jgi:ATP-dependent protease HslVU (ClpYQ) ATPase subunit
VQIANARKLLVEEEAAKLINEEDIRPRARQPRAERHRVPG